MVTKLLEALTSSSDDPASDARNLLDQYSKLVYTCTPDFKRNWISRRGTSDLDMVKIFELDVPHYQQQCLKVIAESDGTPGSDLHMYLPLFRSVPQKPHANDPFISESMAFSVQMLETAQQAGQILKPADWLDEVLYSLLSRICKRKPSPRSARKILMSVAHSVQQQSGDITLKQYASDLDKRYWRKMVQLWQRDPIVYEPILTPLLRAHTARLNLERSPYCKDKASIQACISSTKRCLRYRLLRWTLLNHPGYRVDIDDGPQLKDNLKVSFSPTLLFSLPSADALSLLERYNAHMTKPIDFKIGALDELDDEPRTELLRLHLMENSDTVFKVARERCIHSRQMAKDSGSQPVRSAWIRAAVCFAVASRSLDLLQEVVLWARRFSRDPKTVIELYGSYPDGGYALADARTVALLSGMPRKISENTTTDAVIQNVCKGNEVMLDLLHSAIQTQSDPSFKPRQWETVKLLFRKVVLVRLQRVNSLQFQLKLTDEHTFAAIWKDTIDTLIKAETIGLASDNASLELNEMSGLMGLTAYSSDTRAAKVVYELSNASLRFIDELAVLREGLWRRHRVTEHPTVTTLPLPWPRGLPIQAHWFLGNDTWRVLPSTIDISKCGGALPFLEKRAKEVVLIPSKQALSPVPSDDEVQVAIGKFVDDYRLALKLYLDLDTSIRKETRIRAAWTHATHYISGDRMSNSERQAYWLEHFIEAGAPPSSSIFSSAAYPDLELPAANPIPSYPVEWRPGPETHAVAPKTRKLDPLTIDCMVQPFPSYLRRSPSLFHHHFDVKPISSTRFWDLTRYDKKGCLLYTSPSPRDS